MSKFYWLPAGVGVILLGAMAPAFSQQAVAPRVSEKVRENAEQQRENAEVRRENAEQRRENAEQNREKAQASGHRIENMDHFMVAWLAPCNEEEVILAKMAQGRSQNPQVKQFADQMIQDHTAFLEKLGKFGHIEETFKNAAVARDPNVKRDAAAAPAATPTEGAVRDTVRAVGETAREVARDVGDAVRSTVGYTDSADACRMKREIHRECLALTERELDKWQGADFDQAYLGQQVGAHIGALATLKTFEKHASNEMRPLIEEARATTEKHLNHANELMQKLGHPATARRTADKVDAQK
jgi:predicted outer membrane protein